MGRVEVLCCVVNCKDKAAESTERGKICNTHSPHTHTHTHTHTHMHTQHCVALHLQIHTPQRERKRETIIQPKLRGGGVIQSWQKSEGGGGGAE